MTFESQTVCITLLSREEAIKWIEGQWSLGRHVNWAVIEHYRGIIWMIHARISQLRDHAVLNYPFHKCPDCGEIQQEWRGNASACHSCKSIWIWDHGWRPTSNDSDYKKWESSFGPFDFRLK
jgi:predicted Zn-ribbon and HTH transcriptional regulator